MGLFSKKRHVGININDRSIEIAIVDGREHPPIVVSHARVELPENCIVRGTILDEHVLRGSLKRLKQEIGLNNERLAATLSVSEYLIFPFSILIKEIPHDRWYETIKKKSAERIPLRADLQSMYVIKESLTRESAVIYVLNRNIIQYYQEILAKEGIEIDFIEPESVAAARFFLPAFHDSIRTYLCDIGKTTTQLISLSRGMPLHSEIIPIGTDRLFQGSSIIMQAVDEIAIELQNRIARLGAHPAHALHVIGGGSLLAPLMKTLGEKGLPIVPGIAGAPLKHAGLSNGELRLYAHAIGSALRGISGVGGNELIDAGKLRGISKPVLSIAQFKNRFVILSAVFLVLIGLFVVLLFTTKKDSKVPVNLNITNTKIPDVSLDVFSYTISSENTPTFIRQDKTIEHTLTIELTGTNDKGERILTEQDVRQSESILRAQIRNELQEVFESQSTNDTRVVFAANSTIFELASTPAIGERAESADITVRGIGFAFSIQEQTLRSIAKDHLAVSTATINNIEIHIPDYKAEENLGTAFIRTTYER